eukprot:c15399_g1_i2.p1 GENE.c15399_g1_i2~~c15399_g1_i2.p1  ORF type:complete len:414 (+),score=23.92 c15399_g1_i2:70-1242(+)
MARLAEVVLWVESALFFVIYRSLHLWQGASRSIRALTKPGSEKYWSLVGSVIRALLVVPTLVLTIMTIRATERHDRAAETKWILWGLLPSGLRLLVSMWTSTIDRQMAYDRDSALRCVILVLLCIRRGADFTLKGRTKPLGFCLGVKKAARSSSSGDLFEIKHVVNVMGWKLRMWSILAKSVEAPLSYVVQKVLVIVLIVLYLWPTLLPDDWTRALSVYSRWARMFTVVVLAILSPVLAWLRVSGFEQLEDLLTKHALAALKPLLVHARDITSSSPSSKREAVFAAFNAPTMFRREMRREMRALCHRSMDLLHNCADDRDTDQLLKDIWSAQHCLKLYRKGLKRMNEVLEGNKRWLEGRAIVAKWERINSDSQDNSSSEFSRSDSTTSTQ